MCDKDDSRKQSEYMPLLFAARYLFQAAERLRREGRIEEAEQLHAKATEQCRAILRAVKKDKLVETDGETDDR